MSDSPFSAQRTLVHRRIEDQAINTPNAVAVVSGEKTLTYRELQAEVKCLARRLADNGVSGGDMVAVILPPSLYSVVSILSIFKRGAVYVPIDIDTPEHRLATIVEDACLRCVLTLTHDQVVPSGCIRIAVRDPPEPKDEMPLPDVYGERAYVMYTSGSTGVPKGVVVGHRALSTFLSSIADVAKFGIETHHLAVTRTTFDISLLELLLPLCHGGSVVIANVEDVNNPSRLLSVIRRHSITSLQVTPSYLRVALQQCPLLTKDLTVFVGGEPLPRDLAKTLFVASAEVWNLYGPTETTIWASAHSLTTADTSESAPSIVTIGKALPNYQICVLDDAGRAVESGIAGVLCISGPALATEYLGKPDLTSEAFISALHDPDELMYVTGDIVRERPDGSLDFLGRVDRQVKIRGVRLELGDIEHEIRRLDGINGAVVIACGNPSSGLELVAFVVGELDGISSPTVLRRRLADRVPAYMVPTRVVFLKSIPVTPHGKTDYSVLSGILSRAEEQQQTVSKCLGTRLCETLGEILGVDHVEITNNFFDLGGDSLNGMRWLNRVHIEFGIDLSLRDLFESETLEELQKRIELCQAIPTTADSIQRDH